MGGAGADKLTGGDDNDSFYYTALTDSGVGVGKRDVITDFADGDSLVFIIDVNSKAAGFQRFNYLNDDFGNVQNANFTGNAGELRSIWTATGYLIEGDVNGDAKADFQIEIINSAHSLTFNTFKINDDILVLD
jgi:Ca2+-binding RTX toxin-like protein